MSGVSAFERRLRALTHAKNMCPPGTPTEKLLLVAVWLYRGGQLEGLPSGAEVESLAKQLLREQA